MKRENQRKYLHYSINNFLNGRNLKIIMASLKERLSVTSNRVKLLKHLDNLKALQEGKAAPVMVHISPTNLCQQHCSHCCFSEREKTTSLDWKLFKDALDQFYELGVRAVEFTGGGEPTLYSKINEATEYVIEKKMKLGMNTNALEINNLSERNWKKFQWIRVALNVFDSESEETIKRFEENVKYLKKITRVTACYIVPQEIGLGNLERVVNFATKHKLISRIAPDCIQTRDGIKRWTDKIRVYLEELGVASDKFIFLSDFNIFLFDAPACMMHLWKPFLYTDGWVYACPSSELAYENGRTMQPRFRVCHASEILDCYLKIFDGKKENGMDKIIRDYHEGYCSYCKYAEQNRFLLDVIRPVEDVEFT